MSGFKKYTAWPIEEDVDSIIAFKCAIGVLKWAALKCRCMWGLVCGATQIKVRVMLDGDTCTVLVTAKVPENLRKGWTGTEFLWCDITTETSSYKLESVLKRSRVTMTVSGL